jgi:hypothetical protein
MTLANFQSDGNLQVRKEYLNRILRGKHIVSEVALKLDMNKIVDLRENRYYLLKTNDSSKYNLMQK